MRRLRGWTVLVALGLAALAAACDSGPSGPGTLTARVTGPSPLGAAVLEVTGGAVEGFEGRGDTQAYGATVSAGRHRVVLVDRNADGMSFGIRVSDLGADPPVVTVIKVASDLNLVTLSTRVEVTIE